MSMHFGGIAAQAAADGVITAEEILALRGAGWADGTMEPEEAEALFLANDALTAPSAEWCDFFVEALSEFVVNTVAPRGYVDQEGRVHREGTMRLATAKDEVAPLQDYRVKSNPG